MCAAGATLAFVNMSRTHGCVFPYQRCLYCTVLSCGEDLNSNMLCAGVLQTQRPQRDGRAHVHATSDVQEDQEADRGPAEVRRHAHCRRGGHQSGI